MSQSSFIYTQLNGIKYTYVILRTQSFVHTQLNGFKYRKWLDITIWLIDVTLTGTTPLGQSGPGSNENEGVLHIPQSSRTGASPSNGLVSYPEHSLGVNLLNWRAAFGVFYSPSWLGKIISEII